MVLVGVAAGMVMMRFAAGIFSRLIRWEPALQHSAYMLILVIAVELVGSLLGFHIGELAQFGISLLLLLLTVAFARLTWLRPLNRLWPPLLFAAALLVRFVRWPIRRLKAAT
ncbi:MAG TPA: hypothetical protein VLA19_27415 [Herpetosiphonaceae bacterium]|nr:hypothetical protein [Herpetosiphonaceae bacterium]